MMRQTGRPIYLHVWPPCGICTSSGSDRFMLHPPGQCRHMTAKTRRLDPTRGIPVARPGPVRYGWRVAIESGACAMTVRGSLEPLVYPVGGRPSRAPAVRESRPPEVPRPRPRSGARSRPWPGPGFSAGHTLQYSFATHLPRPQRRTRRHAEPGRPDVRVVRGRAVSAGACARIRCAISQPIPAGSRLPDRPQAEESKWAYGYQTPGRAVGIGRPASQRLPEYADRPIPSPNCSSAYMRCIGFESVGTGPRER